MEIYKLCKLAKHLMLFIVSTTLIINGNSGYANESGFRDKFDRKLKYAVFNDGNLFRYFIDSSSYNDVFENDSIHTNVRNADVFFVFVREWEEIESLNFLDLSVIRKVKAVDKTANIIGMNTENSEGREVWHVILNLGNSDWDWECLAKLAILSVKKYGVPVPDCRV